MGVIHKRESACVQHCCAPVVRSKEMVPARVLIDRNAGTVSTDARSNWRLRDAGSLASWELGHWYGKGVRKRRR
jgi:hypothetical protein